MNSGPDPFEGIENDPPAPPMLDPDPGALDRELESQIPPAQAQPAAINPKSVSAKPTTKQELETRLVRIKPYNKKRRHLTRRYTVFGVKFEVERGWYRVKGPVADYLENVTSDGDPDSPLIFDVCSEEEALAIETKERRRAMELAGMGPYRASDPREIRGDGGLERMGAMTTRDLREGYNSRHDRRHRSSARE